MLAATVVIRVLLISVPAGISFRLFTPFVLRPGPVFLVAWGGTKKRGPITILGQMLTE